MRLKYAGWLIFPAILFSCSTSQITSSWKAETKTPQKFNKILVLSLIRENESAFKEKMEEHLVGDLHDAGYNAISSTMEYGPKSKGWRYQPGRIAN